MDDSVERDQPLLHQSGREATLLPPQALRPRRDQPVITVSAEAGIVKCFFTIRWLRANVREPGPFARSQGISIFDGVSLI